jgi:aconitate hydratase
MSHPLAFSEQTLSLPTGKSAKYYSLKKLEEHGYGGISRLPISIRVVLESVLRNCDGKRIEPKDLRALANWKPNDERTEEIPFVVARVLLQDFTGVPLGVDLAAMRTAMKRMKKDPSVVEPLVPVDLVIDHSVQVDHFGQASSLEQNLAIEFERNQERYKFLKWCMQSFETFKVIPPGFGICHQVNLEYLAQGVFQKDGVLYPDTLVGTDSHTTMVNGLGIVAWGVGGIEAEASMLGQPMYFLTPDVVGVHLTGKLASGVTTTDLVLAVTELLRRTKVVGKFVEFFGEGARTLTAPDRATIGNMAPEYGATMGFFPSDEKTLDYFAATGRSKEHIDMVRAYLSAQGLFGIPLKGEVDYSAVVELDLATIVPAVAGPKRPQDRIALKDVKSKFSKLLAEPLSSGGYGKDSKETAKRIPAGNYGDLGTGDVLIAAITSCTNTSNPSVMLAAGLVAKKAVERGLKPKSFVKTSLAPGSRVVSDYLTKAGLQTYLDQIGFQTVGYGCTTCIGNSGPLDAAIEECVVKNDLVGASVLSGNRNFEARVHQNIKANFLMSPPLVVAYALAGSMNIDLATEPLGKDKAGKDVFLKDIWPTPEEVGTLLQTANDPSYYRKNYTNIGTQNERWNAIPQEPSVTFDWDKKSTYIQEPSYFENFAATPLPRTDIVGARSLAIFGDSVTTDHISPAGAIKASSPAGLFLQKNGVGAADFNSYGARRGNHEVMVRGTFANVRIKNIMIAPAEGGSTLHYPSNEKLSIYDAAMRYAGTNTPLIIFAGQEYGTGSSRDWAAKGTKLLGVRAVIAQSFERIHRSNLVGMGVLPLQFKDGANATTLGIKGDETFELRGLENGLTPRGDIVLHVTAQDGSKRQIPLTVRIDTTTELEYYKHDGILPYVLRQIAARS